MSRPLRVVAECVNESDTYLMTRTRTLYATAAMLAVSASLVACGSSAANQEVTLTPVAAEKNSALDSALEGNIATPGTLDDALEGADSPTTDAAVPVTVIGGTNAGVDVPAAAAALDVLEVLRAEGIEVHGIKFASSAGGESVAECTLSAARSHGFCGNKRVVAWNRSSFADADALSQAYAVASDVAGVISADQGGDSKLTSCLTGIYAGAVARGDSSMESTPDSAKNALAFILPAAAETRNAWIDGFSLGFDAALNGMPSPCAS